MAGTVEVKCKIVRFEDNPKGGQNIFIEATIGKRFWIKELWVNYDRPISMEQFKAKLSDKIWPSDETDNLRYVKEEAEEPFIIKAKRIGRK